MKYEKPYSGTLRWQHSGGESMNRSKKLSPVQGKHLRFKKKYAFPSDTQHNLNVLMKMGTIHGVGVILADMYLILTLYHSATCSSHFYFLQSIDFCSPIQVLFFFNARYIIK